MSKHRGPVFKQVFPIFVLVMVGTLTLSGVSAQDLEATIAIDADKGTAAISGRFTGDGDGPRNLSFTGTAIGADRLSSRIDKVELSGADGSPIAFKRLNSSEFAADARIVDFKFSADLSSLKDPRSAAHASWVAGDLGIIFLDDILPHSSANGGRRATVRFIVPDGWSVMSTETAGGDGLFDVNDRGRAVFILGKGIRRIEPPRKGEPVLLINGNWLHTDAEAAEMMLEIYRGYVKLFGGPPSAGSMVVLFPFPQPGVGHGTWEAETRGSSVLIASAGMAFEYPAKQRLHEQLRHELFHLWIPNAVGLTGTYDWFYEGFAMYISLKTAVSLKRIRFDDMLDTLSRAYRIDRSATRRRSLVESSRERWAGGETQVYARGLLAAFLCDIAMLNQTGGKGSVERLLRDLFQKHTSPSAAADGNSAILAELQAVPALRSVVNDVILGREPVNWDTAIAAAGLEFSTENGSSGLKVKGRTAGRQRTVLRKLGYNGR
ncbi:MAG: hypothetical protein AB7Q37_09670 [Pyrinomonadaceae bacterium]